MRLPKLISANELDRLRACETALGGWMVAFSIGDAEDMKPRAMRSFQRHWLRSAHAMGKLSSSDMKRQLDELDAGLPRVNDYRPTV